MSRRLCTYKQPANSFRHAHSKTMVPRETLHICRDLATNNNNKNNKNEKKVMKN